MTAPGRPSADDQGKGAQGTPTGAIAGTRPEPQVLPRSVLLGALRLMPSTATAAIPAVLATAAVQSALMYLDVQSGFSPAFVLSFLLSAVVTLLLYGLLTACALTAADRPPEPGASRRTTVVQRLRAHVGLFAGWAFLQWLAILLVSVINPLLIVLVAGLTPFLPLAAVDGHRNALATNLRVIARRPGRWLLTCVVLLVGGLVLFLLSVANTLFVQGTPAAAIFWLSIGLVAWWVLTAWALIYRAAPAGSRVD